MIIDTGNRAFMLLCSSLVMLMTPGLAFFYGGLVGRKNVLAGRRTVTAISEFS
jgi:Amt family ammonium transporter